MMRETYSADWGDVLVDEDLLLLHGVVLVVRPPDKVKEGVEAGGAHINEEGGQAHDDDIGDIEPIVDVECISGGTGEGSHADDFGPQHDDSCKLLACHGAIIELFQGFCYGWHHFFLICPLYANILFVVY